ncbi:hypothetical protein FRC09_010451 [Ceratobasidium sp. 395]|nr:hypothetical protein FRC09_010451 [Ceratobasidium sp. 395]
MASPEQQSDSWDSPSPTSDSHSSLSESRVQPEVSSEDVSPKSHGTESSSLEEQRINAYLNGLLRRILASSDDPMGIYEFIQELQNLAIGDAPSLRKRKIISRILDLADADARKKPLLQFHIAVFHRWFEYSEGDLLESANAIIDLEAEMLRLIPESDPDRLGWLEEHAESYERRFNCTGSVEDIENSIKHYELAISLTPDGDSEEFLRYSALGNSYWRLFQRLGRINDLKSGLRCLDRAALLAPDGHPHRLPLLANQGILYRDSFEHSGNIDEAHKSISCLKTALLLAPDDECRLLWLSGLGNSYQSLFESSGTAEDLDISIKCHEQALLLSVENSSHKPGLLNNLGRALLRRSESSDGTADDIRSSIRYLEEAVQAPSSHPEKFKWLNSLGVAYKFLYKSQRDENHIRMAISHSESAISLMPEDFSKKSLWFDELGCLYALLFALTGSREPIEKWISYLEQALEHAPGDGSDRAVIRYNLAGSYQCLLERFGETREFEGSLDETKEAWLNSKKNPSPFAWLYHLGVSHKRSFDCSSKLDELHEAINLLNQANLLTHNGHSNKPDNLFTLGQYYLALFSRVGELHNIDKSISLQEQSLGMLPQGHDDYPRVLDGLGITFHSRFERLGDMEDLKKSLNYHQQAVQSTPYGHPDKSRYLINLGPLYLRMFEQLGKMADLQESMNCLKQALELVPSNMNEETAACLNNLAYSYLRSYEYTGQPANLEDSICYSERAVSLTTDEDTAKPARLCNLGNSYKTLFHRLGKIEDLEKGIKHQKDALLLTPDDHPMKPQWFGHLADSYLVLFDHLGKLDDLEAATRIYEKVINSTPDDHLAKAFWLNGLGQSYDHRYEQSHQLEDAKKALGYHHQAVSLARSGNLDKSGLLSALGATCQSLFEHTGSTEYIDRAIEHQEHALSLVPDGYLFKSGRIKNLAVSHMSRFKCSDQRIDAEKAREYFRQATKMPGGDSTAKLISGKGWAWSCSKLQESPLEAYASTMELVPQIVWLGSSVSDRYERVAHLIRDLATTAAAAACLELRCDVALEWLEAGRAVVWNQLMQLRTPLNDLSVADPDLAEQLREISYQLQQPEIRHVAPGYIPTRTLVLGQADQQYRRLADSWDQLLAKARRLPGFQDFLRPKPFIQLTAAATSSTIVVVNVHSDRCDAIALLKDSLTTLHIPLLNFTYDKAVRNRKRLVSSLNSAHARVRSERQPIYFAERNSDHFCDILDTLWNDIVSPILNALGFAVRSFLSTLAGYADIAISGSSTIGGG